MKRGEWRPNKWFSWWRLGKDLYIHYFKGIKPWWMASWYPWINTINIHRHQLFSCELHGFVGIWTTRELVELGQVGKFQLLEDGTDRSKLDTKNRWTGHENLWILRFGTNFASTPVEYRFGVLPMSWDYHPWKSTELSSCSVFNRHRSLGLRVEQACKKG